VKKRLKITPKAVKFNTIELIKPIGKLSNTEIRPTYRSQKPMSSLSNSAKFYHDNINQEYEVSLKESEERYRALVANIPGAVYRCAYDNEWTMIFLSDAIFEIAGYPASDFINNSVRSFTSIIYHEDRDKINTFIEKSREARQPYILEYRIICADGSIRWVYDKGQGIYGKEENYVVFLDGVILDITERKRAEENLRYTQEFLNAVLKNLPVGVFIKDAEERRFMYWNTASEKIFGYSREEALGKKEDELFPSVQAVDLEAQDCQVIKTGSGVDIAEEYMETPHRGNRIFHTKKVPLFDGFGKLRYLLGIAEDITERKQNEQELSRLALVAQKTQNAVIITDENGCIDWVNEGFTRLTGYRLEEVKGKTPGSFLQGPKTDQNTVKEIRKSLKKCRHFDGEIFNYHKMGIGYWISISIAPIYHHKTGDFQGFIAVESDITERKNTEEALRESESHYRSIVETASEGVWMFDADSKTTFANSRIAEMLGSTVEEMMTRSLFDFLDEESQEIAKNYIERRRQGIQERHDFKFIRRDGSHLWAIVSATPMFNLKGEFEGVLRMITDISDRKKFEEALKESESQLRQKNEELAKAFQELQHTHSMMVQNEKMVSLGQLVAGVAHEINNPVNFIYGNVSHAKDYFQDILNLIELYQKEYPQPSSTIQEEIEGIDLNFILEDLPNLLNSMKMGADRIRSIVLSLKNFSRLDEAEQKAVDIHDGIDSTLLILGHRLKEQPDRPKINIVKSYGNLPPIECYPGELNQVFMNIISNGIDALEDAIENSEWKERKLPEIATCPFPSIHLRTDVKYKSKNSQKPSHIVIRIADNGMGIPLEIQKRLFDPFFTTKPVGKGTGLGLSISYKIIVEKHFGKIRCISAPDQGAEFVIELPVKMRENS
jgi:two-component system, NtrC family, sensor kinase